MKFKIKKPKIQLIKRIYSVDRRYHVISPYTGRLLPVKPIELQQRARELAAKLDIDEVHYIVGFPQQGLIPGYAIALETGLPFIAAQKARLENQDTEIVFLEPHQEKKYQRLYMYGVEPGSTVIIVDDEICTGRTFCNAICAFKEKDIKVKDIGTFIFSGSDETLKTLGELGYNLKYIYNMKELGKRP